MFLNLARRRPCRMYITEIEDYVQALESADPSAESSAAHSSLAPHLQECRRCREAVEAAKLSRKLLREARGPRPDPGAMFAPTVIAQIRAYEAKVRSQFEFWNPIEIFARRLALASSVLLLVLSSAFYEMRVFHGWSAPEQDTITDRFPELLPEQPANNDEALVSLAEKTHE